MDGPKAIDQFPSDVNNQQALVDFSDDREGDTVLAPRPDGLVRETKTKKVVTREEVNERTETEDVKHLGDFSDEVSKSSFLAQLQKHSHLLRGKLLVFF